MKMYADERRGAKTSDLEVGDRVLVQQDKQNKLTTNFDPTPHQVTARAGNAVVVQAPSGALYDRNTTHVRRYMEAEPAMPPEMPTLAEMVREPVSGEPPGGPEPPSPRRSQRAVAKPDMAQGLCRVMETLRAALSNTQTGTERNIRTVQDTIYKLTCRKCQHTCQSELISKDLHLIKSHA